MISAIIVDDETNNISNLKALLNHCCPELKVIESATNAEKAREQILQLQPDVVFLDIEMPGENGFALLRSIKNPSFEVIFVTAHDSYAVAAIKFSALDYLLKPIDPAELKAAVQKAARSIELRKQNQRLEHLLDLLNKPKPDLNEKIALPTQKEIFFVPVKDIVRCESSNNYTSFVLTTGARHLISRPLYEYDELLTPYGFIRCHQSHLVNKIHIASMLNEDGGYLVMNYTNDKIIIARQRKEAVKRALR